MFHFYMTIGTENPYTKGFRLSITALQPNEEIVVSTLFSHRSSTGREYRIRNVDGRRTIDIFYTTPSWSRAEGTPDIALVSRRNLSDVEIAGLEETMAYYREAREEMSSATKHVRLKYFRNGKLIGDEFFIGFSLTSDLASYDRAGMRGDPDYAYDYAKLAVTAGISEQRVHRMIPFETLEFENSTLSPEPSSDSNTP